MFFLDWFFCLVLMESYGTDFSLVLGCFGVSLSFLRPTCRLSSALQGTTASVVQQCAASQRRRLSVTSRHTVILFVHLGFSWKATKCDLDCDLLTGTKLQTESLFRARANYFEHFWRCWKCLKATARFTEVTVPTSRSDRSSKPIQALHIHVDFLRLTQGAGSQRWPAQAAKFVANTSTRTLTLQGQLVRTAYGQHRLPVTTSVLFPEYFPSCKGMQMVETSQDLMTWKALFASVCYFKTTRSAMFSFKQQSINATWGVKPLHGCLVGKGVLENATRTAISCAAEAGKPTQTGSSLDLIRSQDKCTFREKYLEGSTLEGPGAHFTCDLLFLAKDVYQYICTRPCHPPMGWVPYWDLPPPPLWGGGVVVGLWYGMLGMYGVYGRSGMACLESMVCFVCMVGMVCMACTFGIVCMVSVVYMVGMLCMVCMPCMVGMVGMFGMYGRYGRHGIYRYVC
jgi:hypothetical protein